MKSHWINCQIFYKIVEWLKWSIACSTAFKIIWFLFLLHNLKICKICWSDGNLMIQVTHFYLNWTNTIRFYVISGGRCGGWAEKRVTECEQFVISLQASFHTEIVGKMLNSSSVPFFYYFIFMKPNNVNYITLQAFVEK